MVSWIAYSTVKLVRIDDRCLGTLHYVFMASIALYIGVVKVGRDLGYVAFEEPVGSVRLSLQAPTVPGLHSDPGDPGYLYNFTSASTLGYCGNAGHTEKSKNPLPCKFWGAMLASVPLGSNAIMMSTRVTESKQLQNSCVDPSAASNYTCVETYTYESQTKYYVGDSERFTLMIDHAVKAPSFPGLQADAASMTGVLEVCGGSGAPITPSKTPQNQDYLSIEQILSATTTIAEDGSQRCGVSLDGISSVSGSNHTRRYDGMIIQLFIEYANTKPWQSPTSQIEYVYRSQLIEGTKAKQETATYNPYPTKRTTLNRHGIEVQIVQTGKLGAVDVSTLLINLTTSLTLLALSTTLVDYTALYLLNKKDAYYAAKYDEVLEEEIEAGAEAVRAHAHSVGATDYKPLE